MPQPKPYEPLYTGVELAVILKARAVPLRYLLHQLSELFCPHKMYSIRCDKDMSHIQNELYFLEIHQCLVLGLAHANQASDYLYQI